MVSALFDFIVGWVVTSSAINTRRAARASALVAERSAWTEAQKFDFQIEQAERAERRARRWRIALIVYGALFVVGVVGRLFGQPDVRSRPQLVPDRPRPRGCGESGDAAR
jgi:hypothetical protein